LARVRAGVNAGLGPAAAALDGGTPASSGARSHIVGGGGGGGGGGGKRHSFTGSSSYSRSSCCFWRSRKYDSGRLDEEMESLNRRQAAPLSQHNSTSLNRPIQEEDEGGDGVIGAGIDPVNHSKRSTQPNSDENSNNNRKRRESSGVRANRDLNEPTSSNSSQHHQQQQQRPSLAESNILKKKPRNLKISFSCFKVSVSDIIIFEYLN
jgi:hypothetical protein